MPFVREFIIHSVSLCFGHCFMYSSEIYLCSVFTFAKGFVQMFSDFILF